MKIEKEIQEMIKALEAIDSKGYHIREFCIQCKKVMPIAHYFDTEHKSIFSDVEHDGIGEWIDCLKWILNYKNMV